MLAVRACFRDPRTVTQGPRTDSEVICPGPFFGDQLVAHWLIDFRTLDLAARASPASGCNAQPACGRP